MVINMNTLRLLLLILGLILKFIAKFVKNIFIVLLIVIFKGLGVLIVRLQQINDQFKRDWCKENDHILLEIPYWDFDRVEETLTTSIEDY